MIRSAFATSSMTHRPALKAGASSETGPVRRTNEDKFLIAPEVCLFAVADGMGGYHAGEVASKLALESLAGFIRRSHEDADCSWPYGIEPNLSMAGNRLHTAISLANRRVFREAERNDDYTGMGSTIAAILCVGHVVVVGHVGDSRAYLFRGGELTQLTQDDTWAVAMLAESPEGSAGVASHPFKNVLTNVLGSKERTSVHIAEHPVLSGDRLLLCSDGLHGVFANAELQRLFTDLSTRSGDDVAGELVREALNRGTRDNVTAVIIDVDGTTP
jgi:serine/threonine protein phosphatase PrpC